MWPEVRDTEGVDVVLTPGQGGVTTVVQLRIEMDCVGSRADEESGEEENVVSKRNVCGGIQFGQLGCGVDGEAGADDKVGAWVARGTEGEDELGCGDMVESDVASDVQASEPASDDAKVSGITSHTDDDNSMQLQHLHREVFSTTRIWLHNLPRTWGDRKREEYSVDVMDGYPGIPVASGSIHTRDNGFAGSSVDGDLMTTKWVRPD
jgi:hypothetical protein